MKLKNRKPFIPQNILWRIEDDKAVIFDEVSGEPYVLNETGTLVWSYINRKIKIHEIIKELQQNHKVAPEIIETDVISILKQFRKLGVVRFSNDT